MCSLIRVAVERASSTCGRLVTEVFVPTTAIVTVTRTVRTRCRSAAPLSSSSLRGTPSTAPQPWPLHTPAAPPMTTRSYVVLVLPRRSVPQLSAESVCLYIDYCIGKHNRPLLATTLCPAPLPFYLFV